MKNRIDHACRNPSDRSAHRISAKATRERGARPAPERGPRPALLAVIALIVLGMADSAYAWGPATHVSLGGSVLSSLSLLPAGIAALLARHRIAYLYGNIAADIVFAKRLSRVKQFCHHWATGFKLLESAEDDETRALGYGYLSHLAADTVAHGKYVPRMVMTSGTTVNFGHFYWELRADAAQSVADRSALKEILSYDHGHYHSEMAGHIRDTFLPYALNKRVFNRMNAIAAHNGFGRTVNAWGRCSRWYLSPQLLGAYHSEAVERILSVLAEGHQSAVLRYDPNGTSALAQTQVHRREVRRLKRRGVPVSRRVNEASRAFAPSASGAGEPLQVLIES